MKKLKYVISILTLLVLALCSNVEAGELNLNKLSFNAELNEDGSMDVTEVWDLDVYDTNTLYKTFELDSEGYDGFSNVTVYEIKENGNKIPFSKIDDEMYHVTKGCYYGLINSNDKYEIAWGVSIDNSDTRKYEINYTVDNIIHKYMDCAELYWQFIGNEFEIDCDVIEGKITLPYNEYLTEEIKAWAHGPLNGTITILNNQEITFNVDNFNAGNMLEIRIATPISLFPLSNKNIKIDKLYEIISEENVWANEANEARERQEKYRKIADIVVIIICSAFGLFGVFKIKKYLGIIKNTPKLKPDIKLDYYREIPGGDDSLPTDATFMKSYYMETNIPNTISAMMLNLALKKAISFEVNSKNNIKVNLLLTEDNNVLKKEEKILYDYLKKVAKDDNYFSMKEMEKYIEKHITSFNKMTDEIVKETKKKQLEKGTYNKENEKPRTKYTVIAIFSFVFLVFTILGLIMTIVMYSRWYMLLIPLVVLSVLLILSFILISRYNYLTQEGINERERWNGLKKYMEDFSLLNEKEVPDLILWEKYLVYATVFGISEKVLKQLKIKYPDMMNDNNLNNTTYMYLMYNSSLNTSFISSINNSITTSYTAGNYSSGSGSGGGFSGGGRWWLRWRRPVVVANI